MTPSPHWVHQRIVVRLTILLDAYVRPRGVGEVFPSPLDVKLQPAWCFSRTARCAIRRASPALGHCEATSARGGDRLAELARHDRVTKRPHHQRNRVSEYWIIDDVSQTVERWTPDDDRPELLAERLAWHPAGVPDPFVLDLVQFFKDVER